MTKEDLSKYKPRYKICISGAAETDLCTPDAFMKTEALGKMIAEKGMVLVTGATTGVPYWAAKGAKSAGGFVVGFSPAVSEAEHIQTLKLPIDFYDLIIYTGFDYSGRNLFMARAADAVISVCGRMGTANEFTIAFEDNKPQGILEGTGGFSDLARDFVEKMHRGPGKIAYSNDPIKLVDEVIKLIESDREKTNSDLMQF